MVIRFAFVRAVLNGFKTVVVGSDLGFSPLLNNFQCRPFILKF